MRADEHACPACGTRLTSDPSPDPSSDPPGTSLRCTRCAWRLIGRDAWRALDPFRQGYVLYMQAAWPTSELGGEQNSHPTGPPAWEAFRRGEANAARDVQDGEE